MAKAAAKTTGTSMAKWEDRMKLAAGKAKSAMASALGGGNFFSIKSGVLSYKKAEIKDNKIDGVIVSEMFENTYYAGDFDPDNPSSPTCFAFGGENEAQDTLVPHPASPKLQHPTCSGCPQNAYGTSDRGKGKACKNGVRLVFIAEGDVKTADLVKKAEVAFFRVPVTSVRNYAKYATDIESTLDRTPLGVVTTVSVKPDPKVQVVMNFAMKRRIEDGDVIGALFDKAEAEQEPMRKPYEQQAEAPAKEQKTRKFTKKPVAAGKRK